MKLHSEGDIIHSTPYMNGRATVLGVFKAYTFFPSEILLVIKGWYFMMIEKNSTESPLRIPDIHGAKFK